MDIGVSSLTFFYQQWVPLLVEFANSRSDEDARRIAQKFSATFLEGPLPKSNRVLRKVRDGAREWLERVSRWSKVTEQDQARLIDEIEQMLLDVRVSGTLSLKTLKSQRDATEMFLQGKGMSKRRRRQIVTDWSPHNAAGVQFEANVKCSSSDPI